MNYNVFRLILLEDNEEYALKEDIVNAEIKNILVIRLSSIGDVLKCTVVIDMLRERYPQANITWLVETKSKGVLIGNSKLDEVIVWERKEWSRQARQTRNYLRFAQQLWNFVKKIRVRNFDLVIDLQGLPRSGLVSFFSGAPYRISYDKARKRSHMWANIRVTPDRKLDKTVMRHYAGLLRGLGIDSDKLQMQMPILHEDEVFAQQFMDKNHLTISRFIIINPATSWKSKCWPSSYYAEIADRIIETYDIPILLTGGPTDTNLIQEIISKMHNQAINACGQTTLRQLAAIIKKSLLFISGDTGSLFIAEAVGTPTLSMFGPTDPDWHAPQGAQHVALSTHLCNCEKSYCENPVCLTKLSPEIVWEEFVKLANRLGINKVSL